MCVYVCSCSCVVCQCYMFVRVCMYLYIVCYDNGVTVADEISIPTRVFFMFLVCSVCMRLRLCIPYGERDGGVGSAREEIAS